MRRKAIWTFLKVTVTLAAIYWVQARIDWGSLGLFLAQIRWPLLVVIAILNALLLVVCAFRWKIVAAASDYHLTLSESLRSYFIGSFFSACLPMSKGGDVVRAYLVAARRGYSRGGLLATVLAERFIGFTVTIGLLITCCAIWVSRLPVLRTTLISATTLLLIFGALLFLASPIFRLMNRLLHRLPWQAGRDFGTDFIRVVAVTLRQRRLLISVIALSVFNQLSNAGLALMLGKAIPRFGAPWFAFIIITLLVFVIVLLPSFGGHGIRESGLVALLGWFSVDSQKALLFALMNLLLVLTNGLIGFLIFLAWKRTRPEQNVS